VRLSGSLDGVSFIDLNLSGDAAWAALRCYSEWAAGPDFAASRCAAVPWLAPGLMAAHVPAHFARRCVRRTAPVPYEQALAAASVS